MPLRRFKMHFHVNSLLYIQFVNVLMCFYCIIIDNHLIAGCSDGTLVRVLRDKLPRLWIRSRLIFMFVRCLTGGRPSAT